MICLSCSDTHATVLDYRKSPKSPEVLILIVGFTSSAGQVKARYESFDAFMRDLRRMCPPRLTTAASWISGAILNHRQQQNSSAINAASFAFAW